MSNVTLRVLELSNFKGLSTRIEPGRCCKISGRNGAGKTSVVDAWCWLFFDKNSGCQSDFSIKPACATDSMVSVYAVLDVNGETVEFQKEFAEKWTKRRGSATAEFTGHTTNFFIDGVPVKKKVFTEKVNEIFGSEQTFFTLTLPTFFSEKLHWQKRRDVLFSLIGDVSINPPDEVVKILDGKTLEERTSQLKAEMTACNKRLKEIPVRIDELSRSVHDAGDVGKLTGELAAVEKTESGLREKLNGILAGGTSHLRAELEDLEKKISSERAEHRKQVEAFFKKKRLLEKSVAEAEFQCSMLDQAGTLTRKTIAQRQKLIEDKRHAWIDVNEKKFSRDQKCSLCGQDLPSEQVENAERAFNGNKAEQLKTLVEDGKKLSDEIVSLEEKIKDLGEQHDEWSERHNTAKMELSTLPEPESFMSKLSEHADELRKKIEAGNDVSAANAVRTELSETTARRADIARQLAAAQSAERTRSRIDDLKSEEKTTAEAYGAADQKLIALENWTRERCAIIEKNIGERFKIARFRLFEQQVNGGVNDVCEIVIDGVPYTGGLNNAMRINAGIDIINTLGDAMSRKIPVFVDAAESVTELYQTDAQRIALYVSDEETLNTTNMEAKNE